MHFYVCRLVRPNFTFVRVLSFLGLVFTLGMLLKEFSEDPVVHLQGRQSVQPPIDDESLKQVTGKTFKLNLTDRTSCLNDRTRCLADRIPCLTEHFKNVLLVISLGTTSEYESIPLFELMYRGAFRNRVYCGMTAVSNESDYSVEVVDTGSGAFLYDCLAQIIKSHPSQGGYLFVGEDVLLNFWNLVDLDQTRIWESEGIRQGPVLYQQTSETWEWWQSPWGLRAMERVYEYLVELNYYDNRKSKLTDGNWIPDWDAGQALNTWLWNGRGTFVCYWAEESIVYIPLSFADQFVNITKHFRASGVRHTIALPTVTKLMGLSNTTLTLNSTRVGPHNAVDFIRNRETLRNASLRYHFVHVSGGRKERRAILNDLRLKEYALGMFLKYEHCT